MMSKLRVILDTNVLISGLLSRSSIPQQVFDYVISSAILLMSEPTNAELERVLAKPKFDKYISLERRIKFFASITNRAELVAIDSSIDICRDPNDNKFLDLAISGKSDYIITGDNDLLVLHPFREVSILSPQDYLSLIHA
ncbi:putative toxin-antitoxin system toxin component, PIN family [Synechococcus sp. PCC 7502]|uniref:putative toxin-antitoxin system toxin component, PIN family n=1 Tax=Synechococcus sp. PCC 7502 TaxID=1173263 RepID=UPI00029FB55C|nr:putative toxin-antitoxin system toxin component, PIN family [Synechococcus sp. PCC 7502]AFY75370.1 putative toxin-antitoxin system toxin component, PIN family [Synechococcus sp. PCC 7502]